MNIPRFLGNDLLTTDYKNCQVVIIPAPLEKTVSYGKGTSQGTEAILKASGYVELYDEELGCEPFEYGIYTHPGLPNKLPLENFLTKLEHLVFNVVNEGKFPVIIGGEHSLSIAPVKALKKIYGNQFSVLQLDAHTDLRDEYESNKYSHACVMRRISEQQIPIIPVGIRSLCSEEALFISNNKINVFYAKDMVQSNKWMMDVIRLIEKDIYITLDIDVLDPSIISHTGTPEPGGLNWYQLLQFFQIIKKQKKNILGFDIVEFSPKKDHEAQSFTCAKLIYKMIGYFID